MPIEITITLNPEEAATIEGALRKLSKIMASRADALTDDDHLAAKNYHRKIAARLAELADLVKRRTDYCLDLKDSKKWTNGESQGSNHESCGA